MQCRTVSEADIGGEIKKFAAQTRCDLCNSLDTFGQTVVVVKFGG